MRSDSDIFNDWLNGPPISKGGVKLSVTESAQVKEPSAPRRDEFGRTKSQVMTARMPHGARHVPQGSRRTIGYSALAKRDFEGATFLG